MKEIEFRINRDGSKVRTEAFGFSGESCVDATKKITDKLGRILDDHDKPERNLVEVETGWVGEMNGG